MASSTTVDARSDITDDAVTPFEVISEYSSDGESTADGVENVASNASNEEAELVHESATTVEGGVEAPAANVDTHEDKPMSEDEVVIATDNFTRTDYNVRDDYEFEAMLHHGALLMNRLLAKRREIVATFALAEKFDLLSAEFCVSVFDLPGHLFPLLSTTVFRFACRRRK